MKKIIFIIFLNCVNVFGQNYPDTYYKVFNKDSLYVFTSDKYILLFIKEDPNQPFLLKSIIPGQYSLSTKLAISESRLLVNNNDTLTLYDLSTSTPSIICNQYIGSSIGILYTFGQYFIVKKENYFKLLQEINGNLEVVEDSLIERITGVNYPLILYGFKVYKYLPGFGLYEAYTISHEGGTYFGFVTDKGSFVYSQIVFRYPNMPPDWCGIVKRKLIEPNFPITFSNSWWGDCVIYDFYQLIEGSERFIYWINFEYGMTPVVVNYTPAVVYTDTFYTFKVDLTDDYIFILGPKIYYSHYSSPSVFNVLDYTLGIESPPFTENSYKLYDNYPNPFNSTTTIEYYLPTSSYIKLGISNVLGEEVAVLADEYNTQGYHKINFQSDDLPSGIYFYWLRSQDAFLVKKMEILK